MLVIGFLIASFAMSTIDTGEYSGGNGGFVRRENIFFPKRQMKLKVTEKCGVYLIFIIMLSAGLSVAGIKLTKYERSKELNEKRIEIRDAVNNFSTDDLADSITELSAAFGLDIKFESHKLGTVSSMKHKNRTDMIITIDGNVDSAIYLKDYTGSVYNDNEWKTLPDAKYQESIFDEFDSFEIYPQDFPYCYNNALSSSLEYNMYIKSEQRGNKSYAPYATDYIGGMIYDRDMNVSSKKRDSKDYSYRFISVNIDYLINLGIKSPYDLNVGNINDEEWRNKIIDYCSRHNILENNTFTQINSSLPFDNESNFRNPQIVSTELLREEYEKFVYENYLQVPDTTAMQEVRETFAEYIDTAEQFEYPVERINVLYSLRKAVADMTKYSLSPGKTPGNRDFVNYFLLENNKGYCTHYATTGVMLARMLGIPARYATGYVIVGDDFNDSNMNPDGSYTIKVKDDRRHAWVEVYIDGYGWVPFEFTAGYSDQTIDTSPTTTTTTTTTTETTTTGTETTGTDMTETTVSDVEPENSSEQTSANNGRNNRTTTAVTTEFSGGDAGDKGENPVLKAMKNVLVNILWTLLVIALVIAVFIARRKIVLTLRNKRLSVKNPVKRIGNIYAYAEKLMKQIGVEFNTMSSRELSAFMEEKYGGVYFEQGEFEKFMNTSLYAAFSGSAPDMADVEENKKLVTVVADKIYNRAGKLEKLYLKYILCLM